ncbi:TetR/AcrR family transcriptional regulator [Rhizohabitans arisaemae]|uniref:TetR/AcrR family transcriptional regulator n=1 Tax=Rhizohabitans arisaemae TaxID=2720610 RepID=UPI0024B125CD|nr:TetR/AcrR family transcriptional regulator [Rhizohabitans arisaemae]
MRTKSSSSEQTFIEAARRAQIVRAAIETIADLGYAKASFARITERARLSSPGLISYHFTNKDELIQEVAAEIYATGGDLVRSHADGRSTAWGVLQAYVEGSVAFYATHRTHMAALIQILFHHPKAREGLFDAPNQAELDALEALLIRGQRDGEFRSFPPRTMAVIIRQSVVGMMIKIVAEPDLDLDEYTRELVTVCELATRAAT